MSKHTPGPWFVATNGRFKVAAITSTTGIYADQMPKDGSLTADARLIAAAPDLLEACRAMLTFIERHAPRGLQPEPGSPVAMARAAIKVVEGEKT